MNVDEIISNICVLSIIIIAILEISANIPFETIVVIYLELGFIGVISGILSLKKSLRVEKEH